MMGNKQRAQEGDVKHDLVNQGKGKKKEMVVKL